MIRPPFVVVSDFDGTITTIDLVVALTTRVDNANQQTVDRINRRELGLYDGLTELFSRLPSGDRLQYEDYLRHLARFRSGFHRFERALKDAAIPFYIVSNGLDFILDAVLGPEEPHGPRRISNQARFDGPSIAIEWRYPCVAPCPGGCGLCKHQVVAELSLKHNAPVVYIGDGVTDINGARRADRVYARSHLAQWLEAEHVAYRPFETFDDILSDLFLVKEAACE